jgi:branched-chain amino acid transport system permease protein
MQNSEIFFGPKVLFKRLLGLAIFSACVLLTPLVVRGYYYQEVLFLCHYYVILASSWALLSGFTGQINFGHAFFVAGAGYCGALLNTNFDWGPWLTLPLGGLLAALCGFLVGSFTLRLRGPYFAAVTFCFAALLYKIVQIQYQFFGGEEGISGIESLADSTVGNYYFSGILMLIVVAFLYFLSKSSFGLILRSIGENETASEGSGINTTYYKIAAFMISAFIAGIGGAMYAHAQMHVGPELAHDSTSMTIIFLAVVGGMGSIVGPVIGAYLLTLGDEFLRFMGEFRLLIYSGAVVVIILFAPKGLLDLILRGFDRFFRRKAPNKS